MDCCLKLVLFCLFLLSVENILGEFRASLMELRLLVMGFVRGFPTRVPCFLNKELSLFCLMPFAIVQFGVPFTY
jgi:hypothetical protein